MPGILLASLVFLRWSIIALVLLTSHAQAEISVCYWGTTLSQPAVLPDRLIFTTPTSLMCINRTNGVVIWKKRAPKSQNQIHVLPTKEVAVVANGKITTVSPEGKLRTAFRGRSGNLWIENFGNDGLIFGFSDDDGGTIGIDVKAWKTKWQSPLELRPLATAGSIVLTSANDPRDDNIDGVHPRDWIAAIDVSTGKERWRAAYSRGDSEEDTEAIVINQFFVVGTTTSVQVFDPATGALLSMLDHSDESVFDVRSIGKCDETMLLNSRYSMSALPDSKFSINAWPSLVARYEVPSLKLLEEIGEVDDFGRLDCDAGRLIGASAFDRRTLKRIWSAPIPSNEIYDKLIYFAEDDSASACIKAVNVETGFIKVLYREALERPPSARRR